jgi:hypothetical protein
MKTGLHHDIERIEVRIRKQGMSVSDGIVTRESSNILESWLPAVRTGSAWDAGPENRRREKKGETNEIRELNDNEFVGGSFVAVICGDALGWRPG